MNEGKEENNNNNNNNSELDGGAAVELYWKQYYEEKGITNIPEGGAELLRLSPHPYALRLDPNAKGCKQLQPHLSADELMNHPFVLRVIDLKNNTIKSRWTKKQRHDIGCFLANRCSIYTRNGVTQARKLAAPFMRKVLLIKIKNFRNFLNRDHE